MSTKDANQKFVRWLHLSDIHAGHKNQSQQAALHLLVSAISHNANSTPFDFILLTGDIAHSGRTEEYGQATKLLLDPLRALPEVGNTATIYATPGNHDLDCDIEMPPVWKDMGRTRQERFFSTGDEGRRTRGSRAKAFTAYSDFIRTQGICSVDPLCEPAASFPIDVRGKLVNMISVVTAFFSDKEVNDRGRAPAPILPARLLLQQAVPNGYNFILGHHPPDWFTPESEQPLHSMLIENSAIYFHGHEHRIRSRFGSRGLTSLGFGAAYQSPADSSPTPYYRNSFAICELTDALHISVFSWDAENGQWRSEQQLPSDFVDPSERLTSGYRLAIPQSRLSERSRAYSAVATAIRSELRIEKCIWLVEDDAERWTQILTMVGLLRSPGERYKLASRTAPPGHAQFRVRDDSANYLVYAVSGHGDLLNYEQLQTINTELDRQDYTGGIVVTLGELSSDAKTLASQLRAKKNIEVLERDELVRRIVRNLSGGLEKAFSRAVDADLQGSLVVTSTGFGLMLQDRTARSMFQIVDSDGRIANESDALVQSVREEIAVLKAVRYDDSGVLGGLSSVQSRDLVTFNRDEYLRKCYGYFDDVKYAPLAAMGFRFKKASLSQIYVEANADVGGESSSARLSHALTEFVESLNLPKAQQDQLAVQLKTEYGANRSAEVGAARRLYQRYNNVVVVGDPGSGKTCFVQHEILAYADPDEEKSDWYSHHLPIYVSLSEAARLLDEKTSLIQVCEIVSARRGISLPQQVVENALIDGRAALFFDGLDEVGFLDKRIALVGEINALVDQYAHRGSRFVMASRPAAVQPVSISEALTPLHLKGLTEDEIRVLAARVLTTRLGEEALQDIGPEEDDLVSKLLEDVQNVPGIARIARNPLLLTLLVLIYASSGTLSARRHIIYTQAVKTLVSVRGRQTRELQLSEADLRVRLGAIALGIFKREIAELPKRSEVLAVLTPLLNRSNVKRSGAEAAEAFIQEVAEATGLLVIHTKDSANADDLITFMHYSFLEYYAAAGLLSRDYLRVVPPLAANPRWRDVITLLFGLLSEQGDVTPLMTNILDESSDADSISQYRTVLALDCASECDVPPERTQELLAIALYNTLSSGAARYSADLRMDLAKGLDDLLSSSSEIIEHAICQGLESKDPMTAAAFADLLGRIREHIGLSNAIVDAFWQATEHTSPVTRTAVLFAIEARKEFRTEKAVPIITTSLRRSVVEKLAALKAAEVSPAILSGLRGEVRKLLDDDSSIVAAAAAQCILMDTLRHGRVQSDSALIETSLRKLDNATAEDTGMSLRGLTLDKTTVQELVLSENANESELAIRHVRLIQGEQQFVYDLILRKLRTKPQPRQQAACLDALREAADAIDLITLADTDLICSLVSAENRNVRIAATRLLGEMPGDQQVVDTLQRYLEACVKTPARDDELLIAARAMSKHVRRNSKLRVAATARLIDRIPRSAEDGFGSDIEQSHTIRLFSVLEQIGTVEEDALAWRLKSLADDFRTPVGIRRQAIYTFGAIVVPTSRSIEAITEMLARDDTRLSEPVYAATAAYMSQVRRKAEYVKAVYDHLGALRGVLCEAWRREVNRAQDSISPIPLRNIRSAIVEATNLMMIYQEFGARLNTSGSM